MSANQPICKTCGVLWVDHMGIQGTCAENSQLRKERDELRQQVENIKNGFEGGCYLCEVVGEMNKRLQKERDDALVDQKLIEELWERRTEMTEMKAQIKQLTKERDEARRDACKFATVTELGSRAYARNRGWDCFKEETT